MARETDSQRDMAAALDSIHDTGPVPMTAADIDAVVSMRRGDSTGVRALEL